MKKSILATLVAMTLVLVLGTGPAFAAFCEVANKKNDAGNIGWVFLDVDFEFVSTNLVPNPGGQIAGGFVDIYVDFNESGEREESDLWINDTFLLPFNPATGDPPELPHGAHNAGPGDNECDGKGVDDCSGS